jgi:hypothetical protein
VITAFKTNEAEFECKAKTTTAESEIEDKIKFKVKAKKDGALKITIEYETETETDSLETETETQYTVVFNRLLEYRKAGSSLAISRSNNPELEGPQEFRWGQDEVVAEWDMVDFGEIVALETDGGIKKFSASTLGDLATFTFTIHESSDDSMDVSANSMKIDFLLENYPWADSGDTFVALICHIETEREVKIESDKNDDEDEDQAMDVLISFNDVVDTPVAGFTPFGQYTWADFAEVRMLVDGNNNNATNATTTIEGNSTRFLSESVNIPVIATISPRAGSVEDDPMTTTFNEIAFSFVGAGRGASQIYWDPEAGIGYMEENDEEGLVGAGTVSAASSAMTKKTTVVSGVVLGVSAVMAMIAM